MCSPPPPARAGFSLRPARRDRYGGGHTGGGGHAGLDVLGTGRTDSLRRRARRSCGRGVVDRSQFSKKVTMEGAGMKINRALVGFGAVAALIAMMGFCAGYLSRGSAENAMTGTLPNSNSPTSPEDGSAAVSVGSAGAVYKEFQQSPGAALAKYRGKRVKITFPNLPFSVDFQAQDGKVHLTEHPIPSPLARNETDFIYDKTKFIRVTFDDPKITSHYSLTDGPSVVTAIFDRADGPLVYFKGLKIEKAPSPKRR